MRGLPPPPSDVVELTQVWQAGTGECETVHWLLAAGADVATPAQLNTLLGDWYLHVLPWWLAATPSDTTCSLLRLTTFGASPQVVEYIPAPNRGAVPGSSTSFNAAVCLTWSTAEPGPPRARNRLPLATRWIADDRQHLSELGFAGATSAAQHVLAAVPSVPAPAGGVVVLGTVHRSRGGAPLGVSTFAPFFDGRGSRWVGTLHRRVHSRRPAPPTT